MMARDFIDHYARGIGLLNYATEGLTADELHARPGPGSWSTAQVVIHLADADLVLADRMKRIIAEDKPPLLAFDENKWVEALGYDSQPIDTAVLLFDLDRRQLLGVLRGLSDAAFARQGIHSERGPRTLEQIVRGTAEHLDHHLRFIYQKRQRLGRAIPERFSE